MKKQKRSQEYDKATGKKLVPLQVWIFPKTKNRLVALANVNDRTLTSYVRLILEQDCDKNVLS